MVPRLAEDSILSFGTFMSHHPGKVGGAGVLESILCHCRALWPGVLNLSRLEASSQPKPLASVDTLQSHTRYVQDAKIFPSVLQVF